MCRVRFGGVNWIPDNSRLSPTENLKSEHVESNRPIHTGVPDTTQTRPSCRIWCGGVIESARPPDKCVQRRSVSGGAGTAGATAGRTRTQNAFVGRSGRLSSHRLTRHRQHCFVVSVGGGVNWALHCTITAARLLVLRTPYR